VNSAELLELWREALTVLAMVAAPVTLVALGVGLVTSLLQAATQLNDSSLSFVPKVAALLVVLALGGGWLLGRLGQHMTDSMAHVTEIGRQGRP
jgi:flagellar biosynthetic protein FliQ